MGSSLVNWLYSDQPAVDQSTCCIPLSMESQADLCPLNSNHTLTFMALPLCDLTAAYRSAPERTDTGWQQVGGGTWGFSTICVLGVSGIPISLLKIQWCLLRNGRGPKVPPEQVLRLQRGIVTSTAEQVIFPWGHGEPGHWGCLWGRRGHVGPWG